MSNYQRNLYQASLFPQDEYGVNDQEAIDALEYWMNQAPSAKQYETKSQKFKWVLVGLVYQALGKERPTSEPMFLDTTSLADQLRSELKDFVLSLIGDKDKLATLNAIASSDVGDGIDDELMASLLADVERGK